MGIWEIFLIGVALAMDAVAVSLTDGMIEPRMRAGKMLCIAGAFAFFQFGMPLLGYGLGYALAELIEQIAPYLSFALLFFIGGKMVFDGIEENKHAEFFDPIPKKHETGAGKLLAQAVATSIDAFAVGVTFLAVETEVGLPVSALLCCTVIGIVTFVLSLPAVGLGRKVGNKFSDKAELLGGVILIFLGVKILLEGILG